MALPVLPDQVAPTSGPLPIISKANLSDSYAGGGGGGGGGPNLVCSTLTTNGGGVPDIQPVGNTLTVGASTLSSIAFVGNLISQGGFGSVTIQSDFTQNDDNDFGFFISTVNGYLPNVTQAHTYLEIQSDTVAATNANGTLDLAALPDGTAYIASYAPGGAGAISTLAIYADNVAMSSITVSTVNGAEYPPKAALPEDAGFNNLQCSTLGVGLGDGLKIAGFPQPVMTYGAISLNGSGTANVGLDYTYTDPYYPFVCYRGTLGATASTLSVSTVSGTSFNIYGEANTSVQWMVVGN